MDLDSWIDDSFQKSYAAIKNAYEDTYGAGSWKKIDVPEDVQESEAKPEKLPFGSKTKLSPIEHHRYTEAKRRLAGKLGMPKTGWGLYGRSIVAALKNKEKNDEGKTEKSMIADDGKPGKSLKETSTEELKATLEKLKPTDPGAEARIAAIKAELKSRGDGGMEKAAQPSTSTSLTPEKARQMLHERSGGHGRPITEQQRKFFGAIGGHLPAPGGKAKKSMSYEDLEDFLEKAKYTSRKRVGNRWVYTYPDDAKKKGSGAGAGGGGGGGGISEKQAGVLVNQAVKDTAGKGESVTFPGSPEQAKKMLDSLPDGSVVSRTDRSGAGQVTMAKIKGKWVSGQPDTVADDWGDDPSAGMKHEFSADEMSKIVSRGESWRKGTVWVPKSGGGAGGEAPKGGGEQKPAAPGGLPKPKIKKIGNATIRDYGEHGIIRSQPGLGHTVLDAEGTEVGEIGEHKSLKAAEQKLMSMKKSLDSFESLEDYIQKSGGLPTHQQGMGHKKSSAVEGGSADGGELAGVGMTSGSSDSAAGPGQDSQGQLKGVSPGGKQKLSEDDAEESKQMTTHKKPIETIKKSAFPADQRDSVARERAVEISRLQKSDDVYIGPQGHPLSHHLTHASGDAEASELVKSEDFYQGGSPQMAPLRPMIEQGVLCKAVNSHGCDTIYSAALTACPDCGAGTVGHRHVPGGPVIGGNPEILEKSIGPGPLLRRPTEEPDIKIG